MPDSASFVATHGRITAVKHAASRLGWIVCALTLCLVRAPDLAAQASPQTPQPPKPSATLRSAIGLYNAKKYQEAVQRLQPLTEREPQEPRVPYYLALCHEQLGRPDEALVLLQQARNLDPSGAIIATPDFETALERLRKKSAETRAQSSSQTLADAQRLIASGDPISALSLLYDARRLQPDNARIRYEMGAAYLTLGWHKQALAAFEKAKQMDPRISFAPAAEFAEKVKQAQTAIAAPPPPGDAARAARLLRQAEEQTVAGNPETALSLLLEARAADPSRAQIYYRLALCYFALERTEKARAALLAAEELDPKITFAPKEEFRQLLRQLGPAPETPETTPVLPTQQEQPKPVTFPEAIRAMQDSAGGVFNFAARPFLPVGGLETLQRSVAYFNRRGAEIYLAVIDEQMQMTATQFAQRVAQNLPLVRGRQIVALDPTSIACLSADVPGEQLQTLLARAQSQFRQDPIVATLELVRGLAEGAKQVRRRTMLHRLAAASVVALIVLWPAVAFYRRRSREEARLARLRARVEWLLYRAEGRLPDAQPAQDRFRRAKDFLQRASDSPRTEALQLLTEALPLAEESAREAEDEPPSPTPDHRSE